MADETRGRAPGTPAVFGKTILEVDDLTVDFSSGGGILQAVRGVSFTLATGECLGIVGESGSGKSVSALAALGLLGKDARVAGKIRLKGSDVSGLSPEQMRSFRGTVASMIFQEPSRSFDPIYSIGKTFQETLRVKDPSLSPDACEERAVQLLTEVHIPGRRAPEGVPPPVLRRHAAADHDSPRPCQRP